MFSRSSDRYVLFIGHNLCRAAELIAAMDDLDLQIRFEASAFDGLEEMGRARPELIFIDSGLTDTSCEVLSEHIRANEAISEIPLICVMQGDPDVAQMIRLLQAGVDDCLSVFESRTHILAKVELVAKRRSSATAMRRYFSELRRRQSQTLDFVRATTGLMEAIDREFRSRGRSENPLGPQLLEEQLDMGLEIVRSLVSILEKEIEAADPVRIYSEAGASVPHSGLSNGRSNIRQNFVGMAH